MIGVGLWRKRWEGPGCPRLSRRVATTDPKGRIRPRRFHSTRTSPPCRPHRYPHVAKRFCRPPGTGGDWPERTSGGWNRIAGGASGVDIEGFRRAASGGRGRPLSRGSPQTQRGPVESPLGAVPCCPPGTAPAARRSAAPQTIRPVCRRSNIPSTWARVSSSWVMAVAMRLMA